MKISHLMVENLRAVASADIHVSDVLAIVGRNNSGKSTILRALSFFFDPSKRALSPNWFPKHDLEKVIRIEVTFDELNEWESEQFQPWIDHQSGELRIAREVSHDGGDYQIVTVAFVSLPSAPWLRDDLISGKKITEWWDVKDELSVAGFSFGDTLGDKKPNVGDWKQAARDFREKHKDEIEWEEVRLENPRGAKNVLKGTLPEFVLVPAVRDVEDETKVTQSSPFGRLVHSVLEQISEEAQDELIAQFDQLAKKLNRIGGEERLPEIASVEEQLNDLMTDVMDCDVELELELPTLRKVFGDARIVVDDGIRSSISTKGHGMQRSMIMTILRYYAELLKRQKAGGDKAERSTIIAVEEPELYMHPQSQRSLMQMLRTIASGRDQVVYTTHSSLFVDVHYFDQICIMRRNRKSDSVDCFPTQLSMETMLEDLHVRKGVVGTPEGIRTSYWHVFNQAVNEGFFADRVVIVEGPSEAYSLPIYASILGLELDRQNVAVVHGDGKGPIDRLGRVFTGLGIPTFFWFDGDKFNADTAVKKKTVELLALLGEPIGSIEELTTTVGEHFAVLERTYEHTLNDEVPHYDSWLEDCGEELGPTGKPLKHRYVADRIRRQIEEDGQSVTDTVPPTIQSIVERVEQLDECRTLLQLDN